MQGQRREPPGDALTLLAIEDAIASIGVIGCRRDIADKIIGRSITSSPSRKDRNFRIGVPATYDSPIGLGHEARDVSSGQP
jgi:hypothetical protein